uniref:Uncharacterized protein n=1 Tax=Anguilla anguilla TaxID=7936 RepID=A0A0E9RNH7_ANGAN
MLQPSLRASSSASVSFSRAFRPFFKIFTWLGFISP